MNEFESWSVEHIAKWIHCFDGKTAETLLKSKNIAGNFLVRQSLSKPGSYTLTVRRGNNDFVHIKIFNYGDFYDVFDGSESNEFASLVDLLFHYWNNGGLNEKKGKPVELLYPILNDSGSVNDKWFYGSITAQLAEKLLRPPLASNGTFLIRRRSSDQSHRVISVLHGDKVEHIVIKYEDGKYFIMAHDLNPNHKFAQLSELVNCYSNHEIRHGNAGIIHLRQPLLVMTYDGPKDTKMEKDICLQEFRELQKQDMREPQKEGLKPENKPRNRYKNILPYDHSRVKLSGDSDYINANYIQMKGCTVKYIATQGCLAGTICDFWQMIWQENTRVIVMVTQLVELGKNKCSQYWPKKDEKICHDVHNGAIRVQLVKEKACSDYSIRTFSVAFESKNADKPSEERNIYQYHFTSWPDKSLPQKPEVLVHFTEEVMHCQTTVQAIGPITVHCSAGIGRTGTFIAIAFLLEQIRKTSDSNVNIRKIVEEMRLQRSGMVQTEAQYKFLYDVLPYIQKLSTQAEYVNASTAGSHGDAAIYQNLDVVQH